MYYSTLYYMISILNSEFIQLSVGVLDLVDKSSSDDSMNYENLSKEIPIFGQNILQLAVIIFDYLNLFYF
jgi:hypothetical protein